MAYKLSKYNYYVTDKSEEKFVIYNTRTGAILAGEIKDLNLLDFLEDNCKYKDSKYYECMIDSGVIIEESINELDLVWEKHTSVEESKITLTILPTMRCNFICPYCYVTDSGFNGIKSTMEQDILEGILKYIENSCRKKKIDVCEIIWFGGEPLLELNKIEFFMNKLLEMANKYSFITTSTIVTNGYLLNQSAFTTLYNAGVRIFQITLDGSENNHDEYRKLSSGEGTFRRIYKNLLNISSNNMEAEVLISLRANFLKNSIKSMESLVDSYVKDFKSDKRFSISFRPVINITGNMKDVIEAKNDARMVERFLIKKLSDEGVDVEGESRMFSKLPEPIKSWCGAGEAQNYIINYDGRIYLCDSYIGKVGESVGDINATGDLVLDDRTIKKWSRTIFEENNKTCLRCKRLPVCLGGCKKEFLESGSHICHWSDDYIYKSLYEIME